MSTLSLTTGTMRVERAVAVANLMETGGISFALEIEREERGFPPHTELSFVNPSSSLLVSLSMLPVSRVSYCL